MKRFCSLLFAASSLLAIAATAESRPHYGGTLRMVVREAPASLDPATLAASGPPGLSSLIFETLTVLDDRGRPQSLLANSWQSEPGNQRWRISLRSGINFHDGTPLDANVVAASLRAGNPGWKVIASGDSLVIETAAPDPDLPAELALARNGISLRGGSKLSGTGPFTISQWEPGRHLALTANRQYHESSPFLDSIDLTFGKNDREQLTLLDLNKADVIEIAPGNIRRVQSDSQPVATSQPRELLALLFSSEPKSDAEVQARRALALAIDTASLNDVVLQGGGEPTGALLPNWLSGYAFAFPAGTSDRAHRDRMKSERPFSWTLAYDASDSIARMVAERILLNARDVGVTLQLTSSSASDLRLVRVPILSCEPRVAVRELAAHLHLAPPVFSGNSITDLYAAETSLLQSRRVIPLLQLRSALAVRANVHGMRLRPDGAWDLVNVWLSPEKP